MMLSALDEHRYGHTKHTYISIQDDRRQRTPVKEESIFHISFLTSCIRI